MSEEAFVEALLRDQPFVPAYFPFDVEINRKGAAPFRDSVAAVAIGAPIRAEQDAARLSKDLWVIDARPDNVYKKGHLPHSINLMEGEKFETWLGSIIQPGEGFYLAGEDREQLYRLIERAAAIGYEPQVREAFVLEQAPVQQAPLDLEAFRQHRSDYTIVDVRNPSEVKESKPFKESLSVPLADLRTRVQDLPTDKPIVVHCAGGYRSAAASSLIQSSLNGKVAVYDLGAAIKEFS